MDAPKIKAFKCYDRNSNDNFAMIVFAETRNKAKLLALSDDTFEGAEYVDISAVRVPGLDGFKNNSCIGDWDDMELRKILVEEYGWMCFEPLAYDCEMCKSCGIHCDGYMEVME